jgi:hypothetical protein
MLLIIQLFFYVLTQHPQKLTMSSAGASGGVLVKYRAQKQL